MHMYLAVITVSAYVWGKGSITANCGQSIEGYLILLVLLRAWPHSYAPTVAMTMTCNQGSLRCSHLLSVITLSYYCIHGWETAWRLLVSAVCTFHEWFITIDDYLPCSFLISPLIFPTRSEASTHQHLWGSVCLWFYIIHLLTTYT